MTCEHFFVRKVLLFKYSYAFIALPGGIGTLDELFEALTLIQTRKIQNFPVVLIGTAYWKPLLTLLDSLAGQEAVASEDVRLLLITDDLDEAMAHLRRYAIDRFRLAVRRAPAPHRWLGEFVPRKAE